MVQCRGDDCLWLALTQHGRLLGRGPLNAPQVAGNVGQRVPVAFVLHRGDGRVDVWCVGCAWRGVCVVCVGCVVCVCVVCGVCGVCGVVCVWGVWGVWGVTQGEVTVDGVAVVGVTSPTPPGPMREASAQDITGEGITGRAAAWTLGSC